MAFRGCAGLPVPGRWLPQRLHSRPRNRPAPARRTPRSGGHSRGRPSRRAGEAAPEWAGACADEPARQRSGRRPGAPCPAAAGSGRENRARRATAGDRSLPVAAHLRVWLGTTRTTSSKRRPGAKTLCRRCELSGGRPQSAGSSLGRACRHRSPARPGAPSGSPRRPFRSGTPRRQYSSRTGL